MIRSKIDLAYLCVTIATIYKQRIGQAYKNITCKYTMNKMFLSIFLIHVIGGFREVESLTFQAAQFSLPKQSLSVTATI